MSDAPATSPPLRLAAMIGGGGRTLMNMHHCIERGEIEASIECVIASRMQLAGVERARAAGLAVTVVDARELDENAAHDRIHELLVAANVDLVCLCGWMRWLRIDPPLIGRVINIHPALLPAFGGQGMYGMHVHRAVVAAGRSFSGCTVHFVDDQYDHGPTILQRACHVLANDTADDLAARVFTQECLAYPDALRLIQTGRVRLEHGRVVLV